MGVYIKDMTLEEFSDYGDYCQTLIGTGQAEEVPPHGDLIDRDPFIDFIKTHWDSYDQWFIGQLEARPTIIEAEEGE